MIEDQHEILQYTAYCRRQFILGVRKLFFFIRVGVESPSKLYWKETQRGYAVFGLVFQD